MPNDRDDQQALEAARKDLRQGKPATTAAGEFVREEMHHREEGKHGSDESRQQAVAIGLSKARKAGIPLKPQPQSAKQKRSKESVKKAYAAGQKRQTAARSAPAKKKATRARARSR